MVADFLEFRAKAIRIADKAFCHPRTIRGRPRGVHGSYLANFEGYYPNVEIEALVDNCA